MQAFTVLIEVWVPTRDMNHKTGAVISASLNANKNVADKKVTTQNIYNVAETRILFGIEVKRIEDVFTIAYPALTAAWKEATDLKLRIMKFSFQLIETNYWKDQEVDDAS